VDTANPVMEDFLQDRFWENRWKLILLIRVRVLIRIPNSKPSPNSEERLPFVIVGDEAFPLKNVSTILPASFSPER
jgi:hypothetical protein